ncbi:ABC transporter permease [Orrella dioscoreae]|uniref:Oligopeptide transport system permease protein OppB (TC 3.A.1.5.1) n=1 Tax=Orrella dioscoreae TaxID=1851544 RepID=A0A1C3K787_9BURK|nr:ABC transporter permease [Orrella dioscoreae]SBT27380.1 Oligopeptide transport system permease protein OppB (TC 3.A.1.5.1) [Orrella dioscoreae]SOE50023.1 Oligopeptide transport system permease protein OppB (TC 3.A.1.5.1) [Orrella dioscoreae]
MTGMGKVLRHRIAKSMLVLACIALLNFFLVRAAPGDPALILAGQSGAVDAGTLAQLRQDLGLDRPLPAQLGSYLWGLAQGDLGVSHRQQAPVLALILAHLPATLLLTVTAYLFALAAGVGLGLAAAARAGRWTDNAVMTLALLAYATPLFWIGLMAVLVFSVQWQWLPAFGYETVGAGYTGWARVLDVGRHLLLPALTLGLFHMAVYARLTRASVLSVRRLDFVRTARAKGLPERDIARRHVLRNALLPLITYAGIQAGNLVGGSLVVETVYAWPGIGRLAYEALMQRDYNLLLGVFLIASVLVVLINLLTDLLYTLADPRIELT